MRSYFDVNPTELIEKTAAELEKNEIMKPLPWASFVKTGINRQRPPANQKWWWIRGASILRKILILGPIGTAKLRRKYGGIQNRGNKPEKFAKASGSVIRKLLQQLEKAGYIKQVEKAGHKGRIVTKEGKDLLDNAAKELVK